MKHKTDMKKIKETAQMLLCINIGKSDLSSDLVNQPYTNSAFVAAPKTDGKHGEFDFINILESSKNLKIWQEYICKTINFAESPEMIYYLITKPCRFTFMKYTPSHLSGQDYAKLLANAWIISEAPNRDVNVSKAELIRMFKVAEPSLLMIE